MALNPTSRPKRNSEYEIEALEGELLLYHLGETKILYCNETAAVIWQLCDGSHTVEEITTLLAEAFPDAAAAMNDDVTATLEQFLTQKVIELA